jgi:uncharacterized protein YciI
MLFALMGEDAPDSLPSRMAQRPEHLARLHALQAEERLILAGPFLSDDSAAAGFCGSLIVAEFASLADAQAWFAADPYVVHGVFASTTVKPYRKVLP